MHRTFSPSDPVVVDLFRRLGSDPRYVRMCLRQQCFRARCSPKPWRVGIGAHLKPRPGTWPINPERMPERQAWVERYQHAAAGYASCRYLESLGSGVIHPAARAVQELHDKLSRATTRLPLA